MRIQGKMMLLALAVLAAVPAMAQEGWLNLFDKETTFGWTPLGDAKWSVENGALASGEGSGGWLAST